MWGQLQQEQVLGWEKAALQRTLHAALKLVWGMGSIVSLWHWLRSTGHSSAPKFFLMGLTSDISSFH